MRRRLKGLSERWSNAPAAIVGAVVLLLLAGIGVIVQSEFAYLERQEQEAQVQAEILSASVMAALDFGDSQAAQEAVEAIRVDRQVRVIGVYERDGSLVASFSRGDESPPATLGVAMAGDPRNVSVRVPVTSGAERIGTVLLVKDREPLSRRVARYFIISLLVLMAALVIGVLGMTQSALRRANRELEERANALVRTNAELNVQISERTRAEDQLRQSQKLQALGQLTGGIAHDFNNLLTVIQGSADMLRRPGLEEARRVRFAEAVVQASGRAAALTGQLLAFARRQPLQPEVIDVNGLIREMTELFDRTLGERITVRTELSPEVCAVEADRAQLESALLNIAVNGRDAMPDGGTLALATAAVSEEGKSMIAISVHDEGSGMDEETVARAIEPFFTTKTVGKGTGLGLSQVYGFATQSGGDVRIDSRPGEGTTVTLILPCSDSQAQSAAAREAAPARPSRTGRILLVEDNEDVGDFAGALLDGLGYEVAWARSGEEALELAAQDRFDAVFTDVVMPGMSGLELADELSRRKPDLPVVLTTGYSDEIAASGTGGRPVVLKPYRLETLTGVLDQILKDKED